MSSSSRRRGALAATLLVIAATATGHFVSTTDAAWSDQAYTKANFGSLAWSTTGSARGAAITGTMSVTVLGTGTIGPIGPIVVSDASPAVPGPVTAGGTTSSVPGLSVLGLVSGSIIGHDTSTSARYQLTAADASASVGSLDVGLSALSLAVLGDLVKFTSTTGHLDTSAACRANGATASATTDLASLRMALLGAAPIAPVVVGNTATGTAVGLTAADLARVSVTAVVTRAQSTVSAPTDPAGSASLVASLTVSVEQRLTTFTSWSTTLGVALTVPLVSSTCALDLP